MEQQFYLGIVEDRKNDPLKLGRVRVRVFGVHSESLDDVPTESLPWAISLMPATSASLSGIGETVAYVEGTLVFLFFQDGASKQQPIILGSAPGIPLGKSPFGSAGTYLTETFDDVTPIEPEIDVPGDGNSGDTAIDSYPPADTEYFDQQKTYYGIDSLYGAAGDKVKLKSNSDTTRIPDDAPTGYVRRFDLNNYPFYYTSEHVTPEGKYWYDNETVASGPLGGKRGTTIVVSEKTSSPRENYKGQNGDEKDAIFFDSWTDAQKEEWKTENGITDPNWTYTMGGRRPPRYIRYKNADGSTPTTVTPESRAYYYKSEHVDWILTGGIGVTGGEYWYDDLAVESVGYGTTSSTDYPPKGTKFYSRYEAYTYSGLDPSYHWDPERNLSSDELVKLAGSLGSAAVDSSLAGPWVQMGQGIGGDLVMLGEGEYPPPGYVQSVITRRGRFYYTSVHVTPEGKYWFDKETVASGPLRPNVATSNNTETSVRSILYTLPLISYRGNDGNDGDIVVVSSNIGDVEIIPTQVDAHVRVGNYVQSPINAFKPYHKYYYKSEHKNTDGKYWYDTRFIDNSYDDTYSKIPKKSDEIAAFGSQAGRSRHDIVLDATIRTERDITEEQSVGLSAVDILRFDAAARDSSYRYLTGVVDVPNEVNGIPVGYWQPEIDEKYLLSTFTKTFPQPVMQIGNITDHEAYDNRLNKLIKTSSFDSADTKYYDSDGNEITEDEYSNGYEWVVIQRMPAGNEWPFAPFAGKDLGYTNTLDPGTELHAIKKIPPAERLTGEKIANLTITDFINGSLSSTESNTNKVTVRKPKSSGVDISRAVTKYGKVVETVYKTLLDFGIKNNNAAIAILSNIGKESKFIPRREDMTYKTVKQLKAIFPSKFGSMSETAASAYLNNEVKLANFVYANSDGNGDEASGDGYKYRGGGLIQLTKKSNYSSIGQSLSIDLVTNPELVLVAETASKVVAQYFINRYGGANRLTFANVDEALTNVTKKVNPGGFANDYPKVVEESKLYVNNGELEEDQSYEISNPNDPENDIKSNATQEEINAGLISRNSYVSNNLGFKDPSEKFPLGSLLNEPDTSRLSRRIVNRTSVATKRQNRRTGIQSTGKDKFSEPPAAYNAQYPYNKVFTSESGHVMEFDDTFGCERVNIFHTSGTFVEMDSKGNQVNKIIGDNFSITEKNGFIYINGTARVSIGGDVKLSIGGNLDIDVGGNLNYTVKGSINTKVGKDISTNVIGNITELVKGKTTETSGGIKSILSSSDIKIDASKVYLNSGSKPITPKVPAATNTTASKIEYNLPESFVDGEIVKFDDVEESQVNEYRTAAIRKGIITQREISDGDKIVTEKNADTKTKKDSSVPVTTPTTLPESCAAFADKTNIPETLQLSKSFNLAMLSTKAVVSHYKVGAQRGLKEHEIVCNLKKVAENCLDPIKVKYPNMFVTSGFRSGSGTSQHELGEAIDMQFTGASKSDYYDIAVWIKNNVAFDKLLLEYKTTGTGQPWIHIAYRTNPRKEIYTFMNNAKVSSDIRKLQ